MAFLAFGTLWGVGALIFMIMEQRLQDMSYFDALYFCFAALLTIGYVPRFTYPLPLFVSLLAVR